MSNERRRFGDPDAPLWRLNRAAKPLAVVIPVFFVVTAIVTTLRWFEVGDEPHQVGSVVGFSLALLIVVSAGVAWSIYWLALARAVKEVREQSPESVVLGARIPKLASDLSQRLDPQKIVLRVDSSGVVLFTVGRLATPVLKLPWRDVGEIAVVEYVEAGFAYEGLAIEGLTRESDTVLQLVTPTGPVVHFPQGQRLVEIARRATALRP